MILSSHTIHFKEIYSWGSRVQRINPLRFLLSHPERLGAPTILFSRGDTVQIRPPPCVGSMHCNAMTFRVLPPIEWSTDQTTVMSSEIF